MVWRHQLFRLKRVFIKLPILEIGRKPLLMFPLLLSKYETLFNWQFSLYSL